MVALETLAAEGGAAAMLAYWRGMDARLLTRRGVRAIAAGGAAPSSTGKFGPATRVERGTTNLAVDPLGVNATTGGGVGQLVSQTNMAYTPVTGETVATYPGVTTAYRATANGGAGTIWYSFVLATTGLAAGAPLACRISLRGAGSTVGRAMNITIRATGGAQANANLATLSNFNLASGYVEFLVTATVDFADRTQITLRVNDAVGTPSNGMAVYVTAVQSEYLAYPTSLCVGSFGTGYAWSGTANASTSTRAAATVQVLAPELSAASGAICAWLRPLWAGSAGVERTLFDRRVDAARRVRCYRTTAGNWRLEWRNAGAVEGVEVTSTHAAGDDVFVAAQWSRRQLWIAAGQATPVHAARSAPAPAMANVPVAIGQPQDGGSERIDAAVGPVLMLDRPLPPSAITALARLASAPRWRAS